MERKVRREIKGRKRGDRRVVGRNEKERGKWKERRDYEEGLKEDEAEER